MTKQPYAARVCRLMVSTPVIRVITVIVHFILLAYCRTLEIMLMYRLYCGLLYFKTVITLVTYYLFLLQAVDTRVTLRHWLQPSNNLPHWNSGHSLPISTSSTTNRLLAADNLGRRPLGALVSRIGHGSIIAEPIQSILDVHSLHINIWYQIKLVNRVPLTVLMLTFNRGKTGIVKRS